MRQRINIIGAGACGIMLAIALDEKLFDIHLYDGNNAAGRKFLVAGDGGLNLTHSEEPSEFIKKFTPSDFLQVHFKEYSNSTFIEWIKSIGIPVFTGTSGRIFPEKGIKPIQFLETLLKILEEKKVKIFYKHKFQGFDSNNDLIINSKNGEIKIPRSETIFCLGGASWPVTGSKGDWLHYFRDKNIDVNNFEASNCAFKIEWNDKLLAKIEGQALKNICLICNEIKHEGEIVLTRFGLEGSGIYPLSPLIREQLHAKGYAEIFIDLKPKIAKEKIISELEKNKDQSNFTKILRDNLNLSTVQVSLLKGTISKEDFLEPEKLSGHIKNFSLKVIGTGPVDDAISTVGGIDLNEVDANFRLKKFPGLYVIGEMLDFDAPTGGYLLQSCFTMAFSLADHLNRKYK